MGDQLDWHLVHSPLEATLGDETVAKARARQIIGEAQADSAGNHHRDRAQGQADAVERGIGKAVIAVERSGPQRLVIVEGEVAPFDRAQSLVQVPEALPARDALDRDATEVTAELSQDLVFEAVERSEIDMAALGLDHLIMVGLLEQRGDAKARTGADDADHSEVGKRPLGTA